MIQTNSQGLCLHTVCILLSSCMQIFALFEKITLLTIVFLLALLVTLFQVVSNYKKTYKDLRLLLV
jgi:hypothetical protein